MFYMLTFTVNVTNIIVFYADQKYGAGKDFLAPVSAGITSMAVSMLPLPPERFVKEGHD